VGYMPKNTLGRKIREGNPSVNIFGRPYQVRAEIIEIEAFSAHADREDLVRYVKDCGKTLKKVFIVHGESSQREAFRKSLKSLNVKACVPRKNEITYLAAAEK